MFIVFLIAALLAPLAAHAQVGAVQPSQFGRIPFTATGAETPRTAADRAAEYANVRDFGAVCDGITDDRTALQAAADYAAANPTKMVYFPPSSHACMTSDYIIVPAGVAFVAARHSATIMAKCLSPGTGVDGCGGGSTSSPRILSLRSGNTIAGLVLDGGGSAFPSPNALVVAYNGVSNVAFRQVKVRNTRGVGVLTSTAVTHFTIDDSDFENIANHWRTTNNPGDRQSAVVFCCGDPATNHTFTVINSRFRNIGLDGVSTQGVGGVHVANNLFDMEQEDQLTWPWSTTPAALGGAIYAEPTVTSLYTAANYIRNVGGNAIDDVSDVGSHVGNVLENVGQAGIGLFARSGATGVHKTAIGNRIVITGRWASNTHLGCISLGNTELNATYQRVLISGNICVDTQVSPTQQFGVWGRTGTTVAELVITADNLLTGVQGLIGGTLPTMRGGSAAQVITAATASITRVPGATMARVVLVGAGGRAGTAISCGADTACSGAGGGGGGGMTPPIEFRWDEVSKTSGVWKCDVAVGQGSTSVDASATTLTCPFISPAGSAIYYAKRGGRGADGSTSRASGGGGGGGTMFEGADASGATGGAGAGPSTTGTAGGSGGNAGGNIHPLAGTGGGGGGATGVAGNGGNGGAATGGGAGGGCDATGEPLSGGLSGTTSVINAQASAGANGISMLTRMWMAGTGGGGGNASKTAPVKGGDGGQPGGGAGGGGNYCDGTGTPGAPGVPGSGAVYVVQY